MTREGVCGRKDKDKRLREPKQNTFNIGGLKVGDRTWSKVRTGDTHERTFDPFWPI